MGFDRLPDANFLDQRCLSRAGGDCGGQNAGDGRKRVIGRSLWLKFWSPDKADEAVASSHLCYQLRRCSAYAHTGGDLSFRDAPVPSWPARRNKVPSSWLPANIMPSGKPALFRQRHQSIAGWRTY